MLRVLCLALFALVLLSHYVQGSRSVWLGFRDSWSIAGERQKWTETQTAWRQDMLLGRTSQHTDFTVTSAVICLHLISLAGAFKSVQNHKIYWRTFWLLWNPLFSPLRGQLVVLQKATRNFIRNEAAYSAFATCCSTLCQSSICCQGNCQFELSAGECSKVKELLFCPTVIQDSHNRYP